MRLIDADELKEIAHEMILEDSDAFNGGWSYDAVTVEEIDEAPTVDAVPVVRCKDCDLLQDCKIGQYLGLDGFCSNADMRKKVRDD